MPTAECYSLPPKTIYDDCKDRGALLLVEFFGTDIKKKKNRIILKPIHFFAPFTMQKINRATTTMSLKDFIYFF